ncbi:BrnT family toxin [Sulfuriferula sp. GW1]|uniref:BrnT family toxin n=1 Tax=Sulfuriferula sp. GW1 TaxID=3345111 RepID=UPI0039AF74AF
MKKTRFEWDADKDAENQSKHGVSLSLAQHAFSDHNRVIAEDLAHSKSEQRYFCFGEVDGGILTVRFTYRGGVIRIFGAGYWRKGKTIYEHENE